MTIRDEPHQSIGREVACLLRPGVVGDRIAQERGTPARPIPIASPTGGTSGWFVGVTVADHIVGFLRFDEAGRFTTYSSFPGNASSLTRYPSAAAWLDPRVITATARPLVTSAAELSAPFLTWDRSPARLAWAVDARTPGGTVTRVFVTGDFAYLADRPGQGPNSSDAT